MKKAMPVSSGRPAHIDHHRLYRGQHVQRRRRNIAFILPMGLSVLASVAFHYSYRKEKQARSEKRYEGA
jgi:hypothetical protein